MRDGVELSTDLYLPASGLGAGPYPVVLIRTAEDNQRKRYVDVARTLSDGGIAVAIQDVRGRQDSDGKFVPFVHEPQDGYDSVEWFASQEWCNGRVGIAGWGYSAWAAGAAARAHPPHLTALAMTSRWAAAPEQGPAELSMFAWLHAVSARVWQEANYVEWDRVLWDQPVRSLDRLLGHELPTWRAWLDGAWASLESDPAPIDLPVLHVTGWYDPAKSTALQAFESLRGRDDQVLVIGPWDDGSAFNAEPLTGWFSKHLNESGDASVSRWFDSGADVWQQATWTAAPGTTVLHLASGGQLTAATASDEGSDSFHYNPDEPVVVTPDLTFFPSAPATRTPIPIDRRFVERRPDVLVWTSDPVTADLGILGCPSVDLSVGSDATETDWWVQLTDVAPSGASTLLADAIARSTADKVTVELGAVGHTIKSGHAVRLSVSSSCFPLYERNPQPATNQVFHGPTRPSRVILPTVGAVDG